MPTDLVAIVPLRSPGDGKTRLAPGLDREARAALAAAMLADVVAALSGEDVRVVVAAGGRAAEAAARALDVEVVPDGPDVSSLDGAIEHARLRVARDADLLVLQADLPLVATADVAAVLSVDASVVIAPTSDGGTSALLRRPSNVIRTAFGPDSARAHARLARAAGIDPALVRRPGLAHDVDVLADLHGIAEAVGPATARVLAGLHLDLAGIDPSSAADRLPGAG